MGVEPDVAAGAPSSTGSAFVGMALERQAVAEAADTSASHGVQHIDRLTRAEKCGGKDSLINCCRPQPLEGACPDSRSISRNIVDARWQQIHALSQAYMDLHARWRLHSVEEMIAPTFKPGATARPGLALRVPVRKPKDPKKMDVGMAKF